MANIMRGYENFRFLGYISIKKAKISITCTINNLLYFSPAIKKSSLELIKQLSNED